MTDRDLYQQLLGLVLPWTVATVEVDPARSEVRVRVVPQAGTQWVCPECSRPCPGYDLREERRWRHLDSCGFETWLLAEMPRVCCPQHGVRTVAVPWATPHSRFTEAFACFAVTVLLATQQQSQAAALLRLSREEVAYLMARVVAAGLERRRESAGSEEGDPIRQVTLDEKHYGRRYRYLTVLGDPRGDRVLEVADTRECHAVETLLATALTARQRAAVEAVTLDLWQGFRRACQAVLPHARQVYDRFHTAQELNAAVDATRRAEHARLRVGARPQGHRKYGLSVLSGTRFWWLRAAETLPEEQRATLQSLAQQGLETGKVWECKEAFRAFFQQADVTHGRAFLQQWYARARALDNRPLNAVVKQFERHEEALLGYLETGFTNSFGEYLNGRIQQLRERARGFRNFQAYRRAILFHLGRLDACPQTFP